MGDFDGMLKECALKMNQQARRFAVVHIGLHVLRTLLWTLLTLVLWSLVAPESRNANFVLIAAIFGTLLGLDFPKMARIIREPDLRLFLMIHHGPTSLETNRFPDLAKTHRKDHLRIEFRRVLGALSHFLYPVVGIFLLAMISLEPLNSAIANAAALMRAIDGHPSLIVLKGEAGKNKPNEPIVLSADHPTQVLLNFPNLVRISWSTTRSEIPLIVLREPTSTGNETVFQSFQMQDDGGASHSEFQASFAITKDVALFIPQISDRRPLAVIRVKKRPVPEVALTLNVKFDGDVWPDDQVLPLTIQARAKSPLQAINLLIRIEDKVHRELVNTITSDRLTKYSSNYSLNLEPYIDRDEAEVEITAEAIDQSVPSPLVGFSNILRIHTASSYGRYQKTLQTLFSLKTMIDHNIETKDGNLPSEAQATMDLAVKQSHHSPFFDAIDRIELTMHKMAIDKLRAQPSLDELYRLSADLDAFLMEHEILDDRERDRDFFVSARGLSRIIEQARKDRKVSVHSLIERINLFLKDRMGRWEIRVTRLQDHGVPPIWNDIKAQNVFARAMVGIEESDRKHDTSAAMNALSSTVAQYRSWIEQLEAAEDKRKKQLEQERQEGLVSAREMLQKIQKLQGQIAEQLDNAKEQTASTLEDTWPVTRMNQNTNQRDTGKLVAKVQTLAPPAAARLQAATSAMEQTVTDGDKKDFVAAESNADLAGRLLRKAEKDAQKSSRSGRSRSRKHVTGDDYYGQAIQGGDIEINHDYRVNARYREEILDEVLAPASDNNNKILLDSYLRRVVR